jgi:ribonuclease P/MRP protein subunit RPP1
MTHQIIISEINFDKARKLIRESKQKFPNSEIIFSSNDDELNRKILEKEKISILLLNQKNRKDRPKQRDSGLNQVLAKLANKNKIIIGINLDEIIESNSIEKEKILSRIKQNIKLCNKNKVQMKFIIQNERNKRNIYDLKSLGLTLGMSTWMIKNI